MFYRKYDLVPTKYMFMRTTPTKPSETEVSLFSFAAPSM